MNIYIRLVLAGAVLLAASRDSYGDIQYRSFSASAAIGPPAEVYAAKLKNTTLTTLGEGGVVNLVKLPGIPAIPAQFSGDIIAAVGAGAARGGFDAAYVSGGDLNKTWGFIFNSGVPFGPTFDEFTGFLYDSGLILVQELLDSRNVMVFPIVGSPEQLSGYFMEPMSDVPGRRGIGLAGLCQRQWVLRYLPPGENVLGLACDELVQQGKIAKKNITFIAAVPGGGSLVDGVMAGTLNGFEFATPFDDVSQLFNTVNNPGTVGLRYVHTPGWHQQFLITWMVINKNVWATLSDAQRTLMQTVARDNVISSYAVNLKAQGPALKFILDNGVTMSRWSMRDQARLRDAAIKFLNARIDDVALPAPDRGVYARILEALRTYISANERYWDLRDVNTWSQYDGWRTAGKCWSERCRPSW